MTFTEIFTLAFVAVVDNSVPSIVDSIDNLDLRSFGNSDNLDLRNWGPRTPDKNWGRRTQDFEYLAKLLK